MDRVRTSEYTLSISFIKTVQLILYMCCSFCDTKRTITICGQKAELFNLIHVNT